MIKKIAIGIGAFLVLFIGALIAIPVIYKDDIKAMLDEQIAANVNADVYFDANQFGLSIFSNFPNLTVSLGDFGVVGKDEFAGDTLASINHFNVELDLMSVISGSEIQIAGITLDEPNIKVIVLENGKANYDIAKSSGDAAPAEDTPQSGEPTASPKIGIQHWEIIDGNVVYDDRQGKIFLEVLGLNHQGKGDFTTTVFDLMTKTKVEGLTFAQEGTHYLSKAKLDADLTLNMDLDKMAFQFKENNIKVNDFSLGFDGSFSMPKDAGYVMDILFATHGNEFKNILSLVPGVFLEGFEDIETKGVLGFDGFVKGTYTDDGKFPGFNVNLNIKDAMFKYPDLPTAVNNIQADISAVAEPNGFKDMLIDVRKFHIDLGENPLDATAKIKGITDMDIVDIDAHAHAKFNLADITKMFPIEGVKSLAGLFILDLDAKGVYSDAQHTIPQIKANMKLADGMVQSADYPIPIEKINILTSVVNESGKMVDTKIDMTNASLLIDGEPFEAHAHVENLDDITYSANVKGGLDFDLIQKVVHLEGIKMAGKMKADITTQGKMSDIEAERYDKLPTSGTFTLHNFEYVDDANLPQGMKVSDAALSFTPTTMTLQKFISTIGSSDMSLTGNLSNYIPYIFSESAVLKGNLAMTSRYFNANEFLTEEEEGTAPAAEEAKGEEGAAPATTESSEAVAIPKNIDFRFNTKIDKVSYTEMNLVNVKGVVWMKNGVIKLDNLDFDMIGGRFSTSGTYDTQDPKKPAFDFGLKIKDLAFSKAYNEINTVKAFAPVSKDMRGTFNTNFNIGGLLGADLMPKMNSLDGGGNVLMKNTKIEGNSVLAKIAEKTGIEALRNPALGDVLMNTEIKDGRMNVKPFDVKVNNQYVVNIEGSSGLDGTLDYKLILKDIPLGDIAKAAGIKNDFVKYIANTKVDLPIKVGGDFTNPKVAPDFGSAQGAAAKKSKEEAAKQVKEQGKQLGKELLEGVKNDKSDKPLEDKLKDQGQKLLKGIFPK